MQWNPTRPVNHGLAFHNQNPPSPNRAWAAGFLRPGGRGSGRPGYGRSSPGQRSTLNAMHDDQGGTWAAPAAAGPVSARIWLPASKSITNRALVLAALSDRPARIANPLRARDTLLAAAALRAMGTEVADDPQGSPRPAAGLRATGTEVADDPQGSPVAWRVTAGQPPA